MFVKRLSQNARIPTRGSSCSAGVDLFSAERVIIRPNTLAAINLDIAVQLPPFTYGNIQDRSSMAKKGLSVMGGVIDNDYRGPIRIMMFNHTDNEYIVEIGHRIAQMVVEKILIDEAFDVENLDYTSRGENGFGSTGL